MGETYTFVTESHTFEDDKQSVWIPDMDDIQYEVQKLATDNDAGHASIKTSIKQVSDKSERLENDVKTLQTKMKQAEDSWQRSYQQLEGNFTSFKKNFSVEAGKALVTTVQKTLAPHYEYLSSLCKTFPSYDSLSSTLTKIEEVHQAIAKYTSEVAELKKEIASLKNELTKTNQEMLALRPLISGYEGEQKRLAIDVESMQNNFRSMPAKIQEIQTKADNSILNANRDVSNLRQKIDEYIEKQQAPVSSFNPEADAQIQKLRTQFWLLLGSIFVLFILAIFNLFKVMQ